jgi:hypothetical protein
LTPGERQEIKARLIEFGFWGVDEPGDPTTNIFDVAILKDRLDARLAKNVYLCSSFVAKHASAREIVVSHLDQEYQLVIALNYIEAVCLAALALPEFLKQHPECAADQNNER